MAKNDQKIEKDSYIQKSKFELSPDGKKESKAISRGRKLEDKDRKEGVSAHTDNEIHEGLNGNTPQNIFDELNTENGYWQHLHLKYPNVLVFVPKDRTVPVYDD